MSSSSEAFGNRLLTDASKKFEQNAWDNVNLPRDNENDGLVKLATFAEASSARSGQLPECKFGWDRFYTMHKCNFFKDRDWLMREFHELGVGGDAVILDAGCGVGNSLFPIVRNVLPKIDSPITYLAVDCSNVALDTLRGRLDNELPQTGCVHVRLECRDLDSDDIDDLPQCDFVILVFTLSSVRFPGEVAQKLAGRLKPGGLLLFKDYARLDMAHTRFKSEQCIHGDNTFLRRDETIARFFTAADLDRMFVRKCGLEQVEMRTESRLQTNRAKKTEMYRRWIVCKYAKPV